MKHSLLLALLIVTVSCGSSNTTVTKPSTDLADFQNTITEEGLFIDLNIIASDSLEGRNTGSAGERKAADYLAKRYAELGLTPIGDDGTYFQNFELSQSTFDSIEYELTDDNQLLDASTHSLTKISNFNKMQGGEANLEGDIVFVGLSATFNVNSDTDVENKWILSFLDTDTESKEPLEKFATENNALGLLLISSLESEAFKEQSYILQGEFGSKSDLELTYLQAKKLTIITINPALAARVLGLNSVAQLVDLKTELGDNSTDFSTYEVNARLNYTPSIRIQSTKTRNVVALLEGTDPNLKEEVIVLSAHYDHLGIGSPDSSGDSIYNGADDDGSGTVGLLHAAQAFATAKNAGALLDRSILFLHVSGEERGLFGSRYYSDHPVFAIDNTIANLNADMIGRFDDQHKGNSDYIYIIGGKIISSGLQNLLEEANKKSVNITLSDRYNDLNDPNQFYRRSDHWNFGRLGVPFIFYFNGTHADYHRPSDEIENIDFEALRKRTQLIYMTTALLSNTDTPPTVDNQQFILRSQQ